MIKTKDWNWSVNLNWARDRYYSAQVDPVYSTQNQWVKDGLRWDWLAVYDWERDPDGNLILYNGLPRRSEYQSFAGYEYPEDVLGWTPSGTVKIFAIAEAGGPKPSEKSLRIPQAATELFSEFGYQIRLERFQSLRRSGALQVNPCAGSSGGA